MLRSCQYCGRIHERKEVCTQKKKAQENRQQNRKRTNALLFRRSNAWTDKSIQIRKRDKYMCLCCKAKMIGTLNQFNTIDLSVHHIIPVEEDYEKRLDDENLITVCSLHHEMCEAGKILREEQHRLAMDSICQYDEL